MKNVYFVQADVSSGKDSRVVYLPYTAGVIVANAWKNETVAAEYCFKEFLFLRNDVENIVDTMEQPSVVGFTNYCWNTEYNLALASALKNRYPECVTVFGGHNIPQDTSFLEQYPQVDFLAFGEGEITFGDLLAGLADDDVASVPNIAYRSNGVCLMSERKSICRNDYASPYLDGWFDAVLEKYSDYEFNTIIETSRGCPNSCAYCDWGPLKEKTRFFPLEKVLAEKDRGTHPIMGFKVKKLWSPPYLQVALDLDNEAAMERIISELPDNDRILLEAGTPLVKKFGVGIIGKIRALRPDAFIIADLKTLDVGRVEVKMAADETADAVAISGLGTVESIAKAIHETQKQGIYSILDMMNVAEFEKKLAKLPEDLKPDIVLLLPQNR